MFTSRLSNKQVSDLCHRLSTGLAAGIDIRRCWKRETEGALGKRKEEFRRVQAKVEQGIPLGEALRAAAGQFPQLLLRMVDVGEQTGQTAEVFARLASHFEMRHRLTRSFWGMLAWPLLQLAFAILVVGVVIWLLGALGSTDVDGKPTDALGIGLVGTRGLIIYLLLVGGMVAAIAGAVVAIRRGLLWIKPVQRWATSLPGLGAAIQKLCLTRAAWTLHLLLNVEMDMRQVVRLMLESTGNDYYIQHTQRVTADIAAGRPLWQALAKTDAFTPHFLDALAVAEETGEISESMARLTRQYEEESEEAMRWISTATGVLIWISIGALITFLIIRMAMQLYLKPMQDLLGDM